MQSPLTSYEMKISNYEDKIRNLNSELEITKQNLVNLELNLSENDFGQQNSVKLIIK